MAVVILPNPVCALLLPDVSFDNYFMSSSPPNSVPQSTIQNVKSSTILHLLGICIYLFFGVFLVMVEKRLVNNFFVQSKIGFKKSCF